MCTHSICFHGEIRKNVRSFQLEKGLSGAMTNTNRGIVKEGYLVIILG